jgi:hypothetical protein
LFEELLSLTIVTETLVSVCSAIDRQHPGVLERLVSGQSLLGVLTLLLYIAEFLIADGQVGVNTRKRKGALEASNKIECRLVFCDCFGIAACATMADR